MRWKQWYRDKVVVVTGGASGLGKSLGLLLADLDAIVYLLDIDQAGLDRVVKGKKNIHGILADTTDFERMQAIAADIFARHEAVDLLINNAGIVKGGPAKEMSPEDFKKSMDVNFWGVVNGIYAFLPDMLKQGHPARIVNLSSAAGLVGLPYVAPYCASKSAVVGLTEAISCETDPKQVKFTLVCPGSVRTNVIKNAELDMPGDYRKKITGMMDKHGADPVQTATIILKAAYKGRKFVFPAGGGLKALWLIKRLSMPVYAWIVSKIGAFGRKIEKNQHK